MSTELSENSADYQPTETAHRYLLMSAATLAAIGTLATGAAGHDLDDVSSLVRGSQTVTPPMQVAAAGNLSFFTDRPTSLNLRLTSAKESPQRHVIKYSTGSLAVAAAKGTGSNTRRRKIWYDAFSPQIGKGLPKAERLTLRSILVTAGMRHNVDPNFLACFYYLEHPRPGDSANENNAAVGLPVKGNGYWRRLSRPYGSEEPYPTNSSTGAAGPFSFMYDTWLVFGVDGNNDGKKDANNLEDGANGAAKYLAANGGTRGASRTSLYNAAFRYNPSSVYAAGAIRTYNLLKSRVEKKLVASRQEVALL